YNGLEVVLGGSSFTTRLSSVLYGCCLQNQQEEAFRVVRDRHRVVIDNTIERFHLILQTDPVPDGPHVVADVDHPGGLDPREDAAHPHTSRRSFVDSARALPFCPPGAPEPPGTHPQKKGVYLVPAAVLVPVF